MNRDLLLSTLLERVACGLSPLPRPFMATLNITARCNSHCVYCSYGTPPPQPIPDLSIEELGDVISSLADFGIKALSLSGGEPFLRSDLSELVRVAVAFGQLVTVTTNGTMLSPKMLSDLASAGLSCLVVSLDTLDPGLYRSIRRISEDRPMSGFSLLQSLRKAGLKIPRVVVNVVLTRANCSGMLDHIEALSSLLHADDVVMIQPYQPPPALPASEDGLRFGRQDLPRLEELCRSLAEGTAHGWRIGNDLRFLRRIPRFLACGEFAGDFRCLTGYSSLYIKESLDVHPCWQLPSVGNLRRNTIRNIWDSQAYHVARERMKRLDCRKCALVCHAPEFLDMYAELVGYVPYAEERS